MQDSSFFPLLPKRKKPLNPIEAKLEARLRDWAIRLRVFYEYVQDAWADRREKVWINAFGKVLKKYKGDTQRIEASLSFLEKHKDLIKQNRKSWIIPTHPMMFGNLIPRIENRAKHLEKTTLVEITVEAKELAKEIKKKHEWPKVTMDFEEAVQASIINAVDFTSRYKRLRERSDNSENQDMKRLSSFLSKDLDHGIPLNPKRFVKWWFGVVYAERSEWENWDGKLGRDSFSIGSSLFYKWGRKRSIGYAGTPKLFDLLLKYL